MQTDYEKGRFMGIALLTSKRSSAGGSNILSGLN